MSGPSIIEKLRESGRLHDALETVLGHEVDPDRTTAVRCFNPDAHENGDRSPSAVLKPDHARVDCSVCGARFGLLDIGMRNGYGEDRAAVANRLERELLNGNGHVRSKPAKAQKDFGPWVARMRAALPDLLAHPALGRRLQRHRIALEELECGYGPEDSERGFWPVLAFPSYGPDLAITGAVLRALVPDVAVKSRTCGNGTLALPQLAEKPDALVVAAAGEKDMLFGLTAVPEWAWISPSCGESQSLKPIAPLVEGRDVAIVYDVDEAGRKAAKKAADALKDRARSVRIVELPLPGTKAAKDLTDFLKDHDGDDLRRVVLATEPTGIVLDPQDPLPSAREFVAARFTAKDTRTLHHHRGEFFAWTGAHYPPAEDAAVKADAYRFLERALRRSPRGLIPFKPNRAKVGDVLDALAAVAHLPADVAPPAWLPPGDGPDPADLLVCENGLLHLPTGNLLPHSPHFFTPNSLDFAFDPKVSPPERFLAFLDELWGDDHESRGTLQEVFGYLLGPDTKQQKVFLIVGPARSGKGTMARILTALLGKANVAGPTLAGLSDGFGLQDLIGKRLAVISDARIGGRTDQHVIAERLLTISGEDTITVPRKYRQAWTGQLTARFLILTNELPRIADASGALASRFVLLLLKRSFLGKEDTNLTATLLGELPGILNWAVEGWRRLNDRGRFVQPEAGREALAELADLSSPISTFLRDRCVIGPELRVEVEDIYSAWRDWCETQGRDHPGTKASFGKDLRAALPALKRTQPRFDGDRVPCYDGIRLLEPGEKG